MIKAAIVAGAIFFGSTALSLAADNNKCFDWTGNGMTYRFCGDRLVKAVPSSAPAPKPATKTGTVTPTATPDTMPAGYEYGCFALINGSRSCGYYVLSREPTAIRAAAPTTIPDGYEYKYSCLMAGGQYHCGYSLISKDYPRVVTPAARTYAPTAPTYTYHHRDRYQEGYDDGYEDGKNAARDDDDDDNN